MSSGLVWVVECEASYLKILRASHQRAGESTNIDWALVKGFNLSYHKGTMIFTMDPYYGNLNLKP